MRICTALVLLLLMPSPLRAQAGGVAQLPGGFPGAGQRIGPPRDSAPPATGTSGIRGRVTAADTSLPIRKAIVRLTAPELRESRTTTTNAEGLYEFKDLPAGRYNVNASKGSFVALSYGQTRAFEGGKPLELAADQTIEKVDFSLPKGGVITGRVLDEFGEPIADVQVAPLRNQFTPAGRRPMMAGRMATTNDIGEFRLFGLLPGQYYLSATLRTMFAGPFDTSDDRSGYAATYFPGTPNMAEAQLLTIGIGETVSDLTVVLTPTRMARITGTVVDVDGKPVRQGSVMVMQRNNGGMFGMPGGPIRPDGTFVVSGLSPGDYTVRAMIPEGSLGSAPSSASADVTVNGSDIDGLRLEPVRPVAITGRLVVDRAAAAALKPETFQVIASPKNPTDMRFLATGPPRAVNSDLTFESTAAPGAVIFRVNAAQPGWMIRSVRLNGADITDTGMDIRGGEDVPGLEIEVTNRIPEISGAVTNSRNEQVTEYSTVVFSQDRELWGQSVTGRSALVRPDQEGRFKVRSIRPGNYYIAAVEYLDQGQWLDPEYLESLRAGASRFTIAEGETKTLDLKLLTER
jgi:protocatechuate 3,4-dioxygenase beta subunit